MTPAIGSEGTKLSAAVEFLVKHEALREGESPWPAVGDKDDLQAIDWGTMFPGGSGEWPIAFDDNPEFRWLPKHDLWRSDLSGDLLQSVEKALRDGLAGHRGEPRSWGWDDTCAWYQPIHFFGYGFGIFIREDCLVERVLDIAKLLGAHSGVPRNAAVMQALGRALLRAAFSSYFLHEQYHHKVECLGFRLHVVERRSLYLPYSQNVYRQLVGSPNQLEESLANADSFLRLKNPPYSRWIRGPLLTATQECLKRSFAVSPPGYKEASNLLGGNRFSAGENDLQARVREGTVTPSQPPAEWDLAPRMMQSWFRVTDDVWTIVSKGKASLLPGTALPLKTCSTRELEKICVKLEGYELVPKGGKGSHVKLRKDGAPSLILPGDRDNLSPVVARNTLRVLGYKISDLPELVRRAG